MVQASEPVRIGKTPRPRGTRFRTARLAAVLMLFFWIGPVTMAQTDLWQLLRWAGAPAPAAATESIVGAGDAVELQPGVKMRLSLKDGSVVNGRFLGRTLLDSALYAPRFLARAQTSDWVPFALGETLRVALRDGRQIVSAFTGYGELSLLLAGLAGGADLRIPFEFAKEILRADGRNACISSLGATLRPSARKISLANSNGILTSAPPARPARSSDSSP